MRKSRLRQQDESAHIDRHDPVEHGNVELADIRHLIRRYVPGKDRRIVVQNIDAAECLYRVLYRIPRLLRVRNIKLDCGCLQAACCNRSASI
jgi:hypothetical protein